MSQLIDFVFSAGGAIVALVVLTLWQARRRTSFPWISITIPLFYFLASIAIVPYAGDRLLTLGYHKFRAEDLPAGRAAVVVLGGGDQFIQGWADRLTVTTPIEAERVLEAARVFRLIAPAWIVTSGGQPYVDHRSLPSAVTMRDELVGMGVPADRIALEAASRSTRENALYSAPLLRARGIDRVVVVTSSSHMRRALGAFSAVGIAAIPAIAPGADPPTTWSDWVPDWRALARSGAVARELAGIPYYWLRGWWKG